MANSETILSAQTHTGDSSTSTVTSEKFKGDGYYGRSDGFHTVQYTLTGFLGTVDIQATLAVNPTEDDWFTVYTQAYPVNNDTGTTASVITNFTGNYVWVRAYISNWTDGTINSIKLNH
jgi:hypothetical protein